MDNRSATWLELFFDLIFVVALGKVTHLLGKTHEGMISIENIITFILLFITFRWVWTLHTSFSNRVKGERNVHKILTLLLMFLLIVLSTTLDAAVEYNHILFLGLYSAIKVTSISIYLTDVNAVKDRKINKRIISVLITGTLVALCGIFVNYIWAAALLLVSIVMEILVIQTALKDKSSTQPVAKEHLVERIGLLAIVLLGESIISLSYGLTKVSWEPITIMAGVFGFLIITMLWWVYFGSIQLLMESDRDKYGSGIIYSHLLVFLSFSLLSSTIRHAILNDLNLFDFRWLTMAGMLFLFIGKQTAYAINYPSHMRQRIFKILIVIAIAGLSLLLPRPEYILGGVAISFVVYIILNYKYRKDNLRIF